MCLYIVCSRCMTPILRCMTLLMIPYGLHTPSYTMCRTAPTCPTCYKAYHAPITVWVSSYPIHPQVRNPLAVMTSHISGSTLSY